MKQTAVMPEIWPEVNAQAHQKCRPRVRSHRGCACRTARADGACYQHIGRCYQLNIHLKPRHSAPNRECRSLARGTGVRFSPTACESLGITIMTRIIVLTASRASELKERISRAKKMNGLSEREYLFLADLLSKLRRGAGARISGRQLASLIEIEARGQAHIEEP